MTVEEGNIEIAKFTEAYLRDRNGSQVWDHKDSQHPLAGGKIMFGYDMQFNSSWDWLMPIVEKIEQTNTHIGVPMVVIKDNWCEILTNHEGVFITCCNEENSKIEAVWQAVIQFITWYNDSRK